MHQDPQQLPRGAACLEYTQLSRSALQGRSPHYSGSRVFVTISQSSKAPQAPQEGRAHVVSVAPPCSHHPSPCTGHGSSWHSTTAFTLGGSSSGAPFPSPGHIMGQEYSLSLINIRVSGPRDFRGELMWPQGCQFLGDLECASFEMQITKMLHQLISQCLLTNKKKLEDSGLTFSITASWTGSSSGLKTKTKFLLVFG